jgi:small-conductance mechanosensitive channel
MIKMLQNEAVQTFLSTMRSVFEGLPDWAITGGSVILAILVGMWGHRIFTRMARRAVRDAHPVTRSLFEKTARPARLAFILLAIWLVMPMMPVEGLGDVFGKLFMVAVIALIGWVAMNAAEMGAELYLRGIDGKTADDLMARTHETQVRVLRRCVDVVIVLVTAGFALMTFETGRQIGLSLFGMAGLASVVVAFAAYPIVKNLVAGIQLAMTQPIRTGDTVDIDGHRGKVDDLTASSVVLWTMDQRRLFVPHSLFMAKPCQKTSESSDVVGTVSIPANEVVPVERVRRVITETINNHPLWNGKVADLQVTDAKDGRVELRAKVSAATLRKARDLRCAVRERLIAFLQREHPNALPVRASKRSESDRLKHAELDLLTSGEGFDIPFDQLTVLKDGTLAYKDSRVLLYIRDVHVSGNRWRKPKYHLANCKALKKMTEDGRIEGYTVAAEAKGLFKVNIISNGTAKRERCTFLRWLQLSMGSEKEEGLRQRVHARSLLCDLSPPYRQADRTSRKCSGYGLRRVMAPGRRRVRGRRPLPPYALRPVVIPLYLAVEDDPPECMVATLIRLITVPDRELPDHVWFPSSGKKRAPQR